MKIGLTLLPFMVGTFALNDISRPLLGVGLTTVAMATLGTLVSFRFGDRITPRKKL